MDLCPACNGSGKEERVIRDPAANVAGWYMSSTQLDTWWRVCEKCGGNGLSRSPVPLIKRAGS